MVDGKGFSLIGSGARNEFYLSHTVNVFSNTVITTVEYLHLQDTIKISVVETGDYGFIRMVVPPSLMDVSNMSLLIKHGTSEAICFGKKPPR